ncbi:MaoC/PaaZ C-terminal domain-containing protein [Streptomyces sp. enrichment culture]|uniref:MaoC family dehydratase n=1 Tax=Streptomyces sp. enrichment culture TaxID=1795815 RepID=UPI003F547759
MPIDVPRVLGAAPRTRHLSWDDADVRLYHLGIGAGVPATDPAELRYTLESRLHVLPAFATVAGGGPGVLAALTVPGVDVDLAAVLHAGHRLAVHRPVPPRGRATATSRVTAVYDKGGAALLVLRCETADDDGPLWTTEADLHVRGEGGFGGGRGPSGVPEGAPERVPDRIVERPVREDQALLYRLCGDRNPLHAEPEFAARAGFDRPVLHGLCTYGMTLKAVVDTALGGDVGRVRSYGARFTGPVFPGDTLRFHLWEDGGDVHVTVTAPGRGDAPVLTGAVSGAAAP